MEVRFGECAIDSSRRLALRRGAPVHLSPKAFDLLEILIASRPRALAKIKLQEHLWPKTFVVEANLSNLVAEIRDALGDDPRRPRYLRTVHGFGYAFCGEVSGEEKPGAPPAHPPLLSWLFHGESRIALSEGDHLIGRNPSSVVPIESRSVSRDHARIIISRGEATLVDLGSMNGTYLRGEKITTPSPLLDGDQIQVGSIILTFRIPSLKDSTEELVTPRRENESPHLLDVSIAVRSTRSRKANE